ncbi:MAG: TraR/DksA family transcriptional regulator [Nocardioidaceae bacterium]
MADIAAALRAKHDAVATELDVLTRPNEDQGSISFGKRVGEGTSQAVDRLSDVAAHGRLRTMLDEIERAQAKLADGSYGHCDVCGKAIGTDRLEARPWATRCVEDARTPR